jgi:NADH-quinone oxidoreductase subunit J
VTPLSFDPLASGPLLAGAVLATVASLWLLLPNGRDTTSARWLGAVLGLAALAAFIATGRRLGGLGEEAVFLIVSLVAVISAAATIVSRSPVYAAIWFALSLAGVAGVLLVLGAQFLGVATIVVYAGAILVMFLFVLMLAQPSGLAPYDRVSSEPLLSAVAGAILLGLLTQAGAILLGVLSLSIGRLSAGPASCCEPPTRATATPSAAAGVAAPATVDTPPAPATAPVATVVDPLAENHVARLGGELFGRHLVAVEAAGVLLLVALIGAIAIVSRGEAAHAAEATTATGSAVGRSAAR